MKVTFGLKHLLLAVFSYLLMGFRESGLKRSRWIELNGFKVYASRELGCRPVLRALILGERDFLSCEEFLVLLDVWVRVFELGK